MKEESLLHSDASDAREKKTMNTNPNNVIMQALDRYGLSWRVAKLLWRLLLASLAVLAFWAALNDFPLLDLPFVRLIMYTSLVFPIITYAVESMSNKIQHRTSCKLARRICFHAIIAQGTMMFVYDLVRFICYAL
jgi:hypothetical protein